MANTTLLSSRLQDNYDDFSGWWEDLSRPTVLVELGVLVAVVLLAWLLARALQKGFSERDERSIWFGVRLVDGVLLPMLLLCLSYAALEVLKHWLRPVVFHIAVPVFIALVVIRVGVKVLKATFAQARWVKALEQTISWVAWLGMVLWVSGLLPVVLNELDMITWKVGTTKLSVRNLLEGMITAGATLLITLWISAGIESRLLRNAKGAELSLRKAVSNATRAVLVLIGVILAMAAVGIDLTALSVLGGAVGVGVGFGLQKLAANYMSGFVILAERSMRIGDVVRLEGGFEGVITQINARYTVVRSASGREAIVPNEQLMTQRVENLSLADSCVNQTITLTLASDSDVELAMSLMRDAVQKQERVLAAPAPSVSLQNLTPDGLEFQVGYWVNDGGQTQGNLRSDINLAILSALRANGIALATPQRHVMMRRADE